MASNAAIIISVSTYEHEQFMSHLPACQRDSDMMLRIIGGTGKYDKLLKLDNSPHSANALARLTEAIREWQELEIEEVFFYYSGHGILHEGEFLFPFTNFHPASKCTTSLPNSQLDQMLRSLAPSVAIKVIDACQAGTEYIKGSSEINEAMNTSKESFKSLYFFTLPRIFKSHMSTSLLAISPRALQNRCSCMRGVKFGTMTSLAILGTIDSRLAKFRSILLSHRRPRCFAMLQLSLLPW